MIVRNSPTPKNIYIRVREFAEYSRKSDILVKLPERKSISYTT